MIEYFKTLGSTLLAQRGQTPFGEFDLLFRSSDGKAVQVVEVKSIRNFDFLVTRLRPRQRQRMRNIVAHLSESYSEVEAMLAFVDGQNKVQIFDEI